MWLTRKKKQGSVNCIVSCANFMESLMIFDQIIRSTNFKYFNRKIIKYYGTSMYIIACNNY